MTLWEIMVGYPGSQDINQHPYYPYRLAKQAWHVYHHSFTKNGRWFLAGTTIANLSFTMFWSFDIQTWILATAINCIWLPDFVAKFIHLHDTLALTKSFTVVQGQEVTLTAGASNVSPTSFVHFERLPLALVSIHDEGFAPANSGDITMRLIARYRGIWSVPAVRISRPGPFGLVSRSRIIPTSVSICVVPTLPDVTATQIAIAIRTEFLLAKNAANHTQSAGMEIIRTHSPGDPSNKIDWRASSRTAASAKPSLQVRASNETQSEGVHIVVDERVVIASISKWQHWSGRGVREPLPIPEFEELISVAYACALSLVRDGHSIASITSQRQRFTQLRGQADISKAFASIAHIETPVESLRVYPQPIFPSNDVILFTLLPNRLDLSGPSQTKKHITLVSDTKGIVTGTSVDEQ